MTTRISATLAKSKFCFLRTVSAAMMGAMLLLAAASGVQAADLLHNSNDTGSGSSKWPNGWGIAGGKYGQFTCDTCHEPNNKANIKNVRTVISTPNGENWPNGSPQVQVVLKNVTSMGDDSAARTSSNRICEVCHSRNRFHNFSTASNLSHGGSLGHPNPKAVCTSCHAHSTGFKAACGGCHGNPPTTATLGGDTGLIGTPRPSDALQPSRAGAHATHVQTRSMVCDTCHYISNGGITMPNQSGTIQIGFFGFGGKVTSGTYVPYTSAQRGYPFASGTPNTTIAAAVPTYADANKCLNVYCHGGGSAANGKAPLTGGLNQAPNWDGLNQNACGNCHATTAANPPTMGSHVKHAGSAAGYGYVCDTCHPAIDVSHVQGSVRWQFSATDQRVAGARYKAFGSATSGNAGATGDLAPSSSYGSCSNIYCHNNTAPTWGATLASDCTGCHGNNASSAAPMVKNAHKAHVNNQSARFAGFNFACAECHAQVVDGTSRIVTNRTLHVNMAKNVDWGTINSGSPAYNGTNCSSTYCHSNGLGGAPNVTPAAWSSVADGTEGTFQCNSCHGGFAGQPNSMNTNRHNNHIVTSPAGAILHKGIACDKCHDMTINPDGQSIDPTNGLHINRNPNVTFAKFANRSGTWVSANKRCDNTYCHGRNNPTWTTTTLNTCGSCHRASNTTNQGLSAAHIKHYNSATTPTNTTNEGWTNVNKSVSANVFMCGTCHSTDPNTQHLNGPAMPNGAAAEVVINLPFTIPPGAERPNTVTRGTTVVADGANYFYSRETSCDTYCHSNGRGGPPVNTMTWDTATTSCGNCHNKAGDANPTWSGAHTRHLTSPVSTAATCNACHAATASGNNSLIAGRRDKHPNGFRNVTSGGLAGGMRWNGTNCTNVYCHFNAPTPNWAGGALATRCSSCHGSTAASGNPMTRNAHKAHVANTSPKFNNFNFGCRECHNTVVYANNTSILSTTLHVNGSQDVAWGPLSTGGGAYNAGACSSIYCHSNGAGTYKPPTNWRSVADGTEGTASCDYCHKGVAGDFKIMSSARHYNHVVQSPPVGIRHTAIGCDKCHDLTVGPDGASIDATSSKHLSRTVDISFFKFSNRSGAWVSGTKTCNVTYCHGGANPQWTTTTINNCGSCHAASASATRAISPTHGKHYNSTTNINKTVGWDNSNASTDAVHIFRCGVCHNVYPETDHLNGPVTQNGAAAQIVFNLPAVPTGASRPNTFVYGTGQNTDGGGYIYSSGTTCDVYCHSDGRGGPSKQVFSWTATTFTCGFCHNGQGDGAATPTWSTPHTKHIRTYAEGGNTNFGCNSCHKSTATNSTTVNSRKFHINGYRNVSTNTWAGGTWNGTICSNVYCHGDGKATPGYVNQTWSTIAAGGCAGCHGSATANNPNNSALSGKHAKHLSAATYALKCSACHYKTADATDNLALKNFSGARYHVNKTRDVILNGTYGGTWASPTCSSTYCHSNGKGTYVNPNWSTLTTNCTSCHGGDATQASKMNTNRHASHMDNVANLGTNFTCSVCHAQTVANGTNTTIAAGGYASHVNKALNVSFGAYSGTTSGASPAITCSSTKCHAARNPVWNAAATTDHKCTKCHGAVGVTSPTAAQMAPGNGRDLDGSNSMTSPTKDIQVGTHQQHLSGLSSTNIATVRCIECHTVPGSATGNNHLGRRAAEVTFANASAARKNGATPTFTVSSGTTAGQCYNVYCHGAAMPKGDTSGTKRTFGAAGIFWNQTSYRPRNATPTVNDCNVCHGAPPTFGLTSSTHRAQAFPSSCSGCHNHLNANGTFANVLLHINGKNEGGGSCVGCHGNQITRTKGRPGKALAAVSTEFGLAWGHKRSGRGTVTDADCIVCHLEGEYATGKPSATYHQDGNINLRDPDGAGETPITNISGGAFAFARFSTSYAAGSRTTTGHTANTIDNVITQKFCVKCHDADGATNTTARTAGGTAAMPFGGVNLGASYTTTNDAIAAGGTINVAKQFATTNASFHPVVGPRSAGYPTTALMKAPYDGFTRTAGTLANSVVINCFDCHNSPTAKTLRTVAAHGSNATDYMRGNATASGSSPTATTGATLCRVCHNPSLANNHGVGSAFGVSTNSGMTTMVSYGCNICHGSAYNTAVVRPVRAQDVHGFLSTVSGSTTYKKAFIRGNATEGYITAHNVQKIGASTYTASCNGMGGTICGGSRTRTYTPGGVY